MDRQNLVRHFFDGVASLLMVATCMRGASFRLDMESTAALAPGLQRAIHHARFHNQHQFRFLRKPLDMLARGVTPDLFI